MQVILFCFAPVPFQSNTGSFLKGNTVSAPPIVVLYPVIFPVAVSIIGSNPPKADKLLLFNNKKFYIHK